MDEMTRLVFVFFATIFATVGVGLVCGLVAIYRQLNRDLTKLDAPDRGLEAGRRAPGEQFRASSELADSHEAAFEASWARPAQSSSFGRGEASADAPGRAQAARKGLLRPDCSFCQRVRRMFAKKPR